MMKLDYNITRFEDMQDFTDMDLQTLIRESTDLLEILQRRVDEITDQVIDAETELASRFDDSEPYDMTDVEADADTLASAGWGTDEDYGYIGEAFFM